MSELINQLGLDWRLLLSQAANFLILLIVLRMFAYKPILKIIRDRREKIEEGLTKAAEADNRLREANEMAVDRLKEADQQALEILRQTEAKSKDLENKLLEEAKRKEADLLRQTDLIIEGKAEEARRDIQKHAVGLVKEVLVKTVELDPKAIDEVLIQKAAETLNPS